MGSVAVSVIIPIYNAESYLYRCLKSICAQTLTDMEIICINDASQDSSLEIIRSFEQSDPRVKCIDLETNGGESHARNVGIAHASGHYIGSVDNDDFIDIDFFELLYDKAAKGSRDIVKGNCIAIKDGRPTFYTYENAAILKDKYNFFCRWWTAIYRREFIINNKIVFPESMILGGDLIFLYNALRKCKSIDVVDATFYHYIRRSDSGDSAVLPTEKVVSVLEAHNIISKIYNDAFGIDMSESQYVGHYLRIIRHIVFDIMFQCGTPDDQYICMKYAHKLLKKCKIPELLLSKAPDDYNYQMVLDHLENEEYAKILNYLTTKRKLQATLKSISMKKRAGGGIK